MLKEIKVENVFDEMYYAETQSIPKQYTSTSYSNLIKSGDLKNLPRNMRNAFPHFKQEIYTKESLSVNISISIFFNTELQTVRINGIKDFEEDSLRFMFIYHLGSRKLSIESTELVSDKYRETNYSTNDPSEIIKFLQENDLTEKNLMDYQNYFLYEKVLSDWFEHNPKSRFSMGDLGDIEIIEADRYEE